MNLSPDLLQLAADAARQTGELLAPVLAGAGAELTARLEGTGRSVIAKLWDRLSGLKGVESTVEHSADDPDFADRLVHALEFEFRANRELLSWICDQLAQAQDDGVPVDGHALVRRNRVVGNVRAEGESVTVEDNAIGRDLDVRAVGKKALPPR